MQTTIARIFARYARRRADLMSVCDEALESAIEAVNAATGEQVALTDEQALALVKHAGLEFESLGLLADEDANIPDLAEQWTSQRAELRGALEALVAKERRAA